MTTNTTQWTQGQANVAGLAFRYQETGAGDPVVVLSHETGLPPRTPFHDSLSSQHRVIAPTFPGFDGSVRPDWMRSVRDLAVCVGQLLDRLDLGAVTLVGLGFGGWVAAELATMRPSQIHRLALVGSFGLQPKDGEILDQFLLAHEDYVQRGFFDANAYGAAYDGAASVEQLLQWDINREMTARIAWKPYMFSQTLPELLAGVTAPTLVAWGREDAVVPLECAEQFAAAIPNAQTQVFDGAGHYLEFEQASALARAVHELIVNR
jgi:pimeloyl-ACP methyl ester carboxylesterase